MKIEKNVVYGVALVVLVAVVAVVGYFAMNKTTLADKVESAKVGDLIEFNAELTDYDDSCAADAQCAAVFGDVKVITNPGFVVGPIVIGTNEASSEEVGSKFDVSAEKTEDGTLTIVGDESLFIKKAK